MHDEVIISCIMFCTCINIAYISYLNQPTHHPLSRSRRMNCGWWDEKQVNRDSVADNWICSEIREPHRWTTLQSHLGIWIHPQLKGFVLWTVCLDFSIRLSASRAWYVRGGLNSPLTKPLISISATPVDNWQGTTFWSLIEVINSFYNTRLV